MQSASPPGSRPRKGPPPPARLCTCSCSPPRAGSVYSLEGAVPDRETEHGAVLDDPDRAVDLGEGRAGRGSDGRSDRTAVGDGEHTATLVCLGDLEEARDDALRELVVALAA